MSARPSTRWLRITGAAGVLLALASLARADGDTCPTCAPQGQYGLFGPDNQTIEDQLTDLVWQRFPPSTQVSFPDAEQYCATLLLPASTSTPVPGWRLPSYKELMTIVDETPGLVYVDGTVVTAWIDTYAAFPGAAIGAYWTSSLYPAAPNAAYTVDFSSGAPSYQSTTGGVDAALVRCVH